MSANCATDQRTALHLSSQVVQVVPKVHCHPMHINLHDPANNLQI